jgi:hypothetical protein
MSDAEMKRGPRALSERRAEPPRWHTDRWRSLEGIARVRERDRERKRAQRQKLARVRNV